MLSRTEVHMTRIVCRAALALAATLGFFGAAVPAVAQMVPKDGFLCCNLRLNGTWASDSNAPRSGDRVLKPGTKVIGLAYGASQIDVEVEGQKISIGNDYSRGVSMTQFAERWIVPKDPTSALKTWTPRIQQAVKAGRIANGMNRKQVLMSLGWPTLTNTPNLDDPVWTYTASNGHAYKVVFNPAWLVKAIDADAATKSAVLLP
jgi:hypothetical protein